VRTRVPRGERPAHGQSLAGSLLQATVSDPQIAAGQLTLTQQAALAAQIYKNYGRWSSVCSAIVCWGLVASV
jgi:hypothetical protein